MPGTKRTHPNRIRELMAERGISGPKLAKGANTSNQQIYRLADGERPLTAEWRERVANAFGQPPILPSDLLWPENADLVARIEDLQKILEPMTRNQQVTVLTTAMNLARSLSENGDPLDPPKNTPVNPVITIKKRVGSGRH